MCPIFIGHILMLSVNVMHGVVIAKKHCYRPQARNADKRENNSAHERKLTAEYCAHDIKAEKTDSAPVNSAYNYKNK